MPKKILIVDDDPFFVDILGIKLKKSGYEVITAGEGLGAMDKIHQEHPDLIILDLMLPALDGYHICRLIKYDERYKHIPIIVISSLTKEKDMKLALEVGANKFLTKPVEPETVLQEINKFLPG